VITGVVGDEHHFQTIKPCAVPVPASVR
jgi:hypothetical protein